MSTITAPSTGVGNRPTSRTPFVIAAALLGVVAVGVVVGPRLGTSSGTTTTTTTVNQRDAVEHRGADSKAAAAGAAARSAATQKSLDLGGKVVASHAAFAPSIETMPQSALPEGMTRAYVGSELAIVALPGSVSTHTTWTDPWVPPYNNPEWVPFIKAHYFQHPATTPPTHEYR